MARRARAGASQARRSTVPRRGQAPRRQPPSAPSHRSTGDTVAPPFDRRAAICGGLVAALACCLYVWTFAGRPSLGDSPESMAGIDSLGVLHAPGYPTYVISGWMFRALVPIGDTAFRVNLFSVICAVATVVLVYC